MPLLNFFERKGLPRLAAKVVFFGLFTLLLAGVVLQVESHISSPKARLELRVRLQYHLHEKYERLEQIAERADTPLLSRLLAAASAGEMMAELDDMLALPEPAREAFLRYRAEGYRGSPPISDRVYRYYLVNQARRAADTGALDDAEAVERDHYGLGDLLADQMLSSLGRSGRPWLVAPLVFLFLLLDERAFRRQLMLMVPNRFLEMALVVTDRVDQAIGNYLRGLILQSGLVALTLFLCLSVVGVPLYMAFIIGLLAGMANPIPFLGPAIGLSLALGYTLIAEEVNSVIPLVTTDNLYLWVLGSVGLTKLLDNLVYYPFVLGGTVRLHPLVVLVGVLSGSLLFGVFGMLLAVPAIVVIKVMAVSLYQQSRAYRLI